MSADDIPEVSLRDRLAASPLNDARDRRLQPGGAPLKQGDQLYGVRGLFRPTVALHTIKRLGPVRHALAQRAIGGFMEVHAPFGNATKD